jgi:hypothetical protein
VPEGIGGITGTAADEAQKNALLGRVYLPAPVTPGEVKPAA